jgi:hypothetical protein
MKYFFIINIKFLSFLSVVFCSFLYIDSIHVFCLHFLFCDNRNADTWLETQFKWHSAFLEIVTSVFTKD